MNFLEDYKMTTINYVLKNIDFRNVDVDISFKKIQDTIKTTSELQSEMDALIREDFRRANREIGDEIKYSEILSDLHAIEGISSLTLGLSSDIDVGWKYENIQFGLTQFPELNDITLTYNGIGE